MNTEDGRVFIKRLAQYVKSHELALANALQLQKQYSAQGKSHQHVGNAPGGRPGTNSSNTSLSSQASSSQATGTFASALSSLGLTSQKMAPAKLYLTANQLYYLLSRFEELGVTIGPMNVRLESIHADSTSMNYVSFLSQPQRPKGRSADQDSLHSVSSVRSVMSSMSSMFSNFSLTGSSVAKVEKRRAQELEDIRYLYSAFTKIPCLKLILDHRVPRIAGYEEFPFDTAVPVSVFKNVSVLEVVDQDFRSFFGWDRLAEQLKSLTLKRCQLDDPHDLLSNIVLDDMEKRRRRSTKNQTSPTTANIGPGPAFRPPEPTRSYSTLDSPAAEIPPASIEAEASSTPSMSFSKPGYFPRQSGSPPRPTSARRGSVHLTGKKPRRNSSSSTSSNIAHTPRNSSSNLLSSASGLPASKWRFLRHLCLADNGMTSISAQSLSPLATTLHSLDLSSNLFSEVPDSLASLMSLRALNLSNCLIGSLHSLARSPLPAITVLNLRGNRLTSIAGIEKLPSLERLDLRENKLKEPAEAARLTGMPEFRDLYISRNPFVKEYSDYRVTIFNLFRKTPGYTEDITIDSTTPTGGERRQLVDRRPMLSSVPVVAPPLDDENEEAIVDETGRFREQVKVSTPTAHIGTRELSETAQTPERDSGGASQQRRKAPRRRVVDMAQDTSPRTPGESSKPGSPEATFVTAIQSPGTGRKRQREQTAAAPEDSSSFHASKQSQSDETRSLKSSSLPINPSLSNSGRRSDEMDRATKLALSNEQYRQKIEALKREYGSNWLSALDDDQWPEASSADFAAKVKEREAAAASRVSMAKT